MSALRFKVGEIALLYSNAPAETYKPAPGTEVEVIAVGPFPAGYSRQINGHVFRWKPAGDYIIDCPHAYGMCVDSELRKRRDPIPPEVLKQFDVTPIEGEPA